MTYDLQIGLQMVWRRAVLSPRRIWWQAASQACSELSVPTVSRRSCTVLLTTFRSTPSAAQGEEVLQEILRSVLQNIHIHATKSKLKQCRQVSALSSKPHLL